MDSVCYLNVSTTKSYLLTSGCLIFILKNLLLFEALGGYSRRGFDS